MLFRLSNLLAFFALVIAVLVLFSNVAAITVSTSDSYYFLAYDIIQGFVPETQGISDLIATEWWAIKVLFAVVLLSLGTVIFQGKRLHLQRRFWEGSLAVQVALLALIVVMLYQSADLLGGKVKYDLGIILLVLMLAVSILGWRVTLRDLFIREKKRKSGA